MKSIPQKRVRLYRRLRRELKKLDYIDSAETISKWIDRSYSYTASCLAGRNSFKPSEIRAVMKELDWPEERADILFPVLGIDKVDIYEKIS